MNEHPEKLDLTSLDIAAEQREKLRQLFPEAITEGGKVDFDRLKATLGEVVDTGKERYGMNWPGKSECFRTIQAPSRATLRPCREESVSFNTAENLDLQRAGFGLREHDQMLGVNMRKPRIPIVLDPLRAQACPSMHCHGGD